MTQTQRGFAFGLAMFMATPIMGAGSAPFGVSGTSFGLFFGSYGAVGAQQVVLQGRVTDSTGKGIASVDVAFPEFARGSRTDAEGRFSFDDVARGERTLVFSRSGYGTETRTVTLPYGGSLDVTLKPTAFRLSPINVTAQRTPGASSLTAQSTSTLTSDQLRRNPTVSLSHALDRLAGVHTLATGQEMGKPVIRGLTGSRVLVLDNGHRMEDYSWSDEDGPSVDSRLAERVELVRGPASVMYGSDAMAGVVNVVPNPLPNAIGRASFTRFGLEGYGASNNREAGTALKVEGADGGFGWRVVGIGRVAEAIHTPAGELENTGFAAANGVAAVGLQGDWGNAALRFTRYGGEFKLLEASGESPVEQPGEEEGEEEGGPVRKLGDNRVQLDVNRMFGGMRLETKAQWQMHELAEVEEEGGEEEGGEEMEGLELVLNTISLDMLLHHSLSSASSGVFGITGVHQTNDTRGIIPFIPDASRNSAAIYGLEQWTSGRFTLTGSARGDIARVSTDGNTILALGASDRDFSAMTYSAGVVAGLGHDVALAGNVGRAWRAPNFFELFANGPQLGEARYVIGSTALEEEHSTSLDAAIRLNHSRVHGEVAAFSNTIGSYIYISPTTAENSGLRVFRYLQADARLTGGEASGEVNATHALTLRGRADYVRGTNRENGEALPLIPPVTLEGGAELHGAFAGMERAYVEADIEHHAAPDRLSPQDLETPAYALLTIGAGFDRHIGSHDLRVDLRVHNATNKDYRDFLWRYKEFASNPGRDIMIRASYDF